MIHPLALQQPSQHPDELLSTAVALVVGQEVTVAGQFRRGAAGHHIEVEPTAAQIVERGRLASRHRGLHESRPDRDHEAKPRGPCGQSGRRHPAVEAAGPDRQQQGREAHRLGHLRDAGEVLEGGLAVGARGPVSRRGGTTPRELGVARRGRHGDEDRRHQPADPAVSRRATSARTRLISSPQLWASRYGS
jgi:hypothetical protein